MRHLGVADRPTPSCLAVAYVLRGQQREENPDSNGRVKFKGGVECSSREVGRWGIPENECSGNETVVHEMDQLFRYNKVGVVEE
ncbi:hypothetical protein E2C01_019052 [Portunus trituberculatus]|uniref:Uncharacterized protein n=1 Tax=Portunus trituberculatus TaxID=210409 RepID=A0A5B7DWW3_PORTR|nr:hypothetical protein [Portunus trituberculatus]